MELEVTPHPLPHGTIIHARAESVYPTIADGSVTLTILDGPYGMRKAEWDKVDDLAAFYRPHIAEVSRVSAASASVYFWNTAEGWAGVHPEFVAAGWTLRSVIVWDKRTPPSMLGWRTIQTWPDATEVCGFYQRGRPPFALSECVGNVWEYSVKALSLEQMRSDAKVPHRGSEGDVYPTIHPCEKPLLFSRRIIEASSRPGDLVLEPFGGTCRAAVANEQIARYHPEQARRTLTIEQDEDGRDYIGAVLRSLGGDLGSGVAPGQTKLFGAAK